MPRIVLNNPHLDNFYASSLCDWLFRKKTISKYSYILNGLYQSKKLCVWLDHRRTSFDSLGRARYFFFPLRGLLEFILWAIVHKMNPLKITIITDKSQLNSDDSLFLFSYLNLDFHDAYINYTEFPCHLCVHLSHFYLDADIISLNVQKLNPRFLISEALLNTTSSFYQYYFDESLGFRLLPFSYAGRFKSIIPFPARSGNCVALGSLSHTHGDHPRYTAFHSFFKTSYLSPFRKELFDSRQSLAGLIDVRIQPPYDYTRRLSGPLQRLLSNFKSPLSKYYSSNLVEVFNNYKMFVAPEEAAGLPAALLAEGMACGCAYLGNLNYGIYNDLGMIDGIHYIGYDGSLDDLRDKVSFYSRNPSALEKIAKAGHSLASSGFNQTAIFDRFQALFANNDHLPIDRR